MQFAFSTVLGGMPVYATDCTYEDTIELLTTCPICSSAVHLRSASDRTYKKSGKTIISNPYFAHYKAGNATDYDCTARCKSVEGQKMLQQRENIFKGQRLEWYNNRLWRIVSEYRNITPQLITRLVRTISIGAIRQAAKHWRKNYKHDRTRIIKEFKSDTLYACIESELRYVDYQSIRSYFYSIDKKLHIDISLEIMDFIATPSGGYALEKFIPTSIYFMLKEEERLGNEFIPSEDFMEDIASAIGSLVISTPWINWFYPKNDNNS